jgi:hypothetical protein
MTDMEADKLNFLDEDGPVEEASHEDVELAPGDPVEEPEALEPEQAETGEQDAEPPAAAPESKQDHVPLLALLDEREKRQEAQRELEALQRRIAHAQQQQQRQQQRPDFFEDPDSAVRQAVAPMEQALVQQKLSQSRFFAEKEFSKDLIERALEYFDQHPAESIHLMNHPSPFHAAVEYFQQHDPRERERLFNEQVEERAKELAAQQLGSSRPKAPPPSMATARGVGKDSIQSGNAFDALFGE